MSKVFIVSDSGHDFSDAKRFGELVVMSQGRVNKYQITGMRRLFAPFIDASSPNDYIVQSGPSIMNAVACAMFAARHKCLNLLLFYGTATDYSYLQRRIRFDHTEREGHEPAS